MEILTHAQDVEAEALADWLIHQLVGQAVKPHMSSQRDRSATFTLIWKGREGRKWGHAYRQPGSHFPIPAPSVLRRKTHLGSQAHLPLASSWSKAKWPISSQIMDAWVPASLRLHNECQYSSHAANYRGGLYGIGGWGQRMRTLRPEVPILGLTLLLETILCYR